VGYLIYFSIVIEMSKTAPNLVDVFRALADENRLAIFKMLRRECGDSGCEPRSARGQRTVGEIADRLGIAISTVSHHLKELERAGLIKRQRQGQRVLCSADSESIGAIHALLGEV
jgi:ArsR family transcriptional regulator